MRVCETVAIPSSDPAFFAARVLREVGVQKPPVPLEPILEYFGLRLRYISNAEIEKMERIAGRNLSVSALLHRNGYTGTILVREDDLGGRQRMSVFHEIGHFDLPWHEHHDYLCDCGIDLSVGDKLEKEAFEYANRLMFPDAEFAKDLHSWDPSIQVINSLADKYGASFSATANRFVSKHLLPCAVVYLEGNSFQMKKRLPFTVKYCHKSSRFHRYWQPGEAVSHHPVLEFCLKENAQLRKPIPASVFGSSKSHEYEADVRPYGPGGLCVLLKEDSPQGTLPGLG